MAVFVTDDVDQAWRDLGPHLLHDAKMAASYRHGGGDVASISRAETMEELRRDAGAYRAVTLGEAEEMIRTTGRLPLAPLCGGGCGPLWRGPISNGPRRRADEPVSETDRSRTMQDRAIRVAVWSTGGIGSHSIRAVTRRPDMELVGVWVHTPAKVGRDAGELAGGEKVGLAATGDAAARVDLRPDCMVYAASGPERDAGAVPDYERFLGAGINVVTTTSTQLVFPPAYDPRARARLEEAAAAGGATLYASGIFPGFASDQLELVAATQSSTIRTIRATEVALNDHYPVASAMVNGLGFGQPMDFEPMIMTPGVHPGRLAGADHPDSRRDGRRARRGERSFRSGPDRQAHLGRLRHHRGGHGGRRPNGGHGRRRRPRRHSDRARDPDGPRRGARLADLDHDATYVVKIDGEPDIELRMSMGQAEGHGAGHSAMLGTAMRVVNAVPYVMEAPPGLLSSLELPLTLPRHAFV